MKKKVYINFKFLIFLNFLMCGLIFSNPAFSQNNISGTQPSTPYLDSVSVDIQTNKIILGWQKSPETDVIGYYIYHRENDIWNKIATINNINTTSYIDNINLSTTSNSYSIASFNSDERSPIGISPTHPLIDGYTDGYLNTILLNANFYLCEKNIKLFWNKYINMYSNTNPETESLEGYKIFRKTSNTNFQLIYTTNKNTTEYTDENIEMDVEYSYYVQAFDDENYKTSSSNIVTKLSFDYKTPAFNYLRHASVKENSDIKILWHADNSAKISEYDILRSENNINFEIIGKITDTINFLPDSTFIDTTALSDKKTYFYKINVFDMCKNFVLSSQTAQTILLSINTDAQNNNILEWNNYSGWQEIEKYNIYRKIEGSNSFEFIDNVSGDINTYTDNISQYINTSGKFSYFIEAVKDENLSQYSFSDTAKSNIQEIIETSEIYMPNAFTPNGDGLNDKIKPIFKFVKDYTFSIYNKWGQKLFETKNIDEGWDGRNNKKVLTTGVYIYNIQYINSNGVYKNKNGTITLLR